MDERNLFIEILKAIPEGSLVETMGYIDATKATELELISFDKFKPNSVHLKFEITEANRSVWTKFFAEENEDDFYDHLIHFWIIKDYKVIVSCYDCFDIGLNIDKRYVSGNLDKYADEFQIYFVEKDLPLGWADKSEQKYIQITKVNSYKGVFSAEIILELNDELLNLRFKIEKSDYETLKVLLEELNKNEHLFFYGGYSKSFNKSIQSQEIFLDVKSPTNQINFSISSTEILVSNMIWFLQIKNKNEIQHLII